MRYRFLSVALEELTAASDYYREISPALAKEFLDEIDTAIQLILSYPSAWQKLSAQTRRCRTARFPYGLVYRVTQEEVVIIAVMHLDQLPKRWEDR